MTVSSLVIIFLTFFYITVGILLYTDIKLLAKRFETKLLGKSLRLALMIFYIFSLVLITYAFLLK